MKKIASVLVLAVVGCGGGDDLAPGTLEISVYGEEFVEAGIPADAFSDGWSVTFDRFLVSLGDVSAAAGHEAPALVESDYREFDLAQPSGGAGQLVVSAEVPGGVYDHVGYRIAPATPGGNAVYIEGTATKGTVSKTFAWGFAKPTTYAHCEGTAVVDGGTATTQITIHADHLFYDDLVAPEPNLAFDLIARADDEGDADGVVTPAELEAVDITAEEHYQVGNFDVTNLWDFIDHQVSTIGHIDGEGHCEDVTRG